MTDTSDFTDPYLDPATAVLRNLLGAQAKADLDRAEADLASMRLVQLTVHPVKASGDLGELQAIHRHLFQDVYAWAGQLRTVDIRKNVEGAEFFLPVAMIERASAFAAGELGSENMLRGLDREDFVKRLSYHYDQFNYIHPFREGNGRVQRVFWNRIAGDAGWQLDWQAVRGNVNDHACRVAAEERDFGPLHQMFDRIVAKAVPTRNRDETWHTAERKRLSFSTSENRRPEDGKGSERPE
jgi:cell filamentation protein